MLLLITFDFGFGPGTENKFINFLIWFNVFKESLNTAVHYKPLPYEYKVKLEDLEEFPELGHEASNFYTNMCLIRQTYRSYTQVLTFEMVPQKIRLAKGVLTYKMRTTAIHNSSIIYVSKSMFLN